MQPSNILLDAECNVKVADFGLARSIASLQNGELEQNLVLTDYVATRWFRAPEILLGSQLYAHPPNVFSVVTQMFSYTKAVDIWSVGCILGEMLGGKPIFQVRCGGLQSTRLIPVVSPQIGNFNNESIGSNTRVHWETKRGRHRGNQFAFCFHNVGEIPTTGRAQGPVG